MIDEQRERAQQTWELVVHDAPSRAVLAALRRVLRVKRGELARVSASLPGVVRRGARVDLADSEAQLSLAGVRCELRRRNVCKEADESRPTRSEPKASGGRSPSTSD